MNQIILSLISGSLIGASLGLLGGGGSILTVPILVYVIGQDVHSAIGISLAIVGLSSLFGMLVHQHNGNVRFKSGILFGVVSMIGAIPGTWLNRLVIGKVILILFGLMMIAVALSMLHKKVSKAELNNTRRPCEAYSLRDWLHLSLWGGIVGFLTGFFGVGGGFLIVPALVLIGNFSPHQAIGTSLLIITMASLSGFLGHLGFGNLDFKVLGLFSVGGLAGVILGSALAGRMSDRKLAKGFAWFIMMIGSFVLYKNL